MNPMELDPSTSGKFNLDDALELYPTIIIKLKPIRSLLNPLNPLSPLNPMKSTYSPIRPPLNRPEIISCGTDDLFFQVMSRTIVKDVHSDGSAGAGSGKADP